MILWPVYWRLRTNIYERNCCCSGIVLMHWYRHPDPFLNWRHRQKIRQERAGSITLSKRSTYPTLHRQPNTRAREREEGEGGPRCSRVRPARLLPTKADSKALLEEFRVFQYRQTDILYLLINCWVISFNRWCLWPNIGLICRTYCFRISGNARSVFNVKSIICCNNDPPVR